MSHRFPCPMCRYSSWRYEEHSSLPRNVYWCIRNPKCSWHCTSNTNQSHGIGWDNLGCPTEFYVLSLNPRCPSCPSVPWDGMGQGSLCMGHPTCHAVPSRPMAHWDGMDMWDRGIRHGTVCNCMQALTPGVGRRSRKFVNWLYYSLICTWCVE